MAIDSVQPLRISKTTPAGKANNNMATSRPLSEIGSTSQRRNSPSYNQATKKMLVSRESSPYTENSPPPSFLAKPASSSPRDFWSTREGGMSPTRFFDCENTPERSPSPSLQNSKRRSSIERLMQASRVKNSNIFALETKDAYDPTTLPIVERPSANRPLSGQLAMNTFTRFDSLRKENTPLRGSTSPVRSGHKRSESEITLPYVSPSKGSVEPDLPALPAELVKEKYAPVSPTKSSLARTSRFETATTTATSFDQDCNTFSDGERASTPRAAGLRGLHRHNKSVTFHEEPPVINEYEHPTPEPSVSLGDNDSREGSWDSDEFYDQDVSFERGSSADVSGFDDDSFDADLENTDKTPVVLPGDWSHMSPKNARTTLVEWEDDVFDPETEADASSPNQQRQAILGREESVASDSSESRPLPPLPNFMLAANNRKDSGSLAAAAEKASHSQRGLPSPPKRASCSKDEIMRMTRESSLTLEERLGLMSDAAQSHERPSSKSSEDTERGAQTGDEDQLMITNLDTGEKVDLSAKQQKEDDNDIAALLYAPPRISRESIMKKVRSSRYDFEEYDETDTSELDASRMAYDAGVSPGRPSYAELAKVHPDQPIPSRENSRETSDANLRPLQPEPAEVHIKEEPIDEEGIDLSSIPAFDEAGLQPPRSPSRMGSHEYDRQGSVLRYNLRDSNEGDASDDDASKYSHSEEPEVDGTLIHHDLNSREGTVDGEGLVGKESLQEAMQLLTVRDYAEPKAAVTGLEPSTLGFMGLPAYLSTGDYDFGMKEYITPSPPAVQDDSLKKLDFSGLPSLQPPAEIVASPAATQEVEEEPLSAMSPPDSPSSVIHHSSEISSLHEEFVEALEPQPVLPESPGVPERRATIKTGGKLKARPSGTPADFETMAEQRRLVSSEQFPVPDIPAAFRADVDTESERSLHSSDGSSSVDSKTDSLLDEDRPATADKAARRQSRKLMLSIPDIDTGLGGDLGLGLESEFDRVIESQKVREINDDTKIKSPTSFLQKGYLMRQNTKVVVASNRDFSGQDDATSKVTAETPMSPTGAPPRPSSSGRRGSRTSGISPRKPSAEQFLKTEPWNGQSRRKSVRNASVQKAPYAREPAPPLPGQDSALGVVDEDYAAGSGSLEDEVDEGVERGRLFVKVVGVKNLDLPMPRNDRLYFQLTLDNGLHCVTTSSLELGRSAAIGQEFELVVLNDLEFQLTLTTKLPPPPPAPVIAAPITAPSSPTKKPSGFSRFLTSPRKRAERERQEREAAEAEERRRQQEAAAQRKRASAIPTAWDRLRELVNAADGSFARAYVNLKSHESQCFGRPLVVDIPCYNEWALEKDTHVVNSVRSKRGANNGPIRKPPYIVGHLELQLLYVPKPRGATDETMPKSMSSATREMNKAREVKEVNCEGHLSQQGGDCTHWRRRFFTLNTSKLTAYHEHTHQKRAVINLSKASRLVDDKTTLVADPTPSGSSPAKRARRKSAFAEEDEGYQYVEEGFRIRFANGETIDFYADSAAEKDRWMEALSSVIGKPNLAAGSKPNPAWTDLVLSREKSAAAAGVSVNTTASASPTKSFDSGTEVRDFVTMSSVSSATSDRTESRFSERKAVPSAPSSPVKKSASTASTAPSVATEHSAAPAERPSTSSGVRPRTPPMKPRTGHRSRNAIKSMIF